MIPEVELVVEVPGPALRMRLNAGCQVMTPTIARARLWEPIETRWILDRLRPGDTFVDVGANVGYFTLLAARAVGEEGRVFAFEPDPDNFELLARNIELNHLTNVVPVQRAVSDRCGPAQLYLSERNKGDHRIFPAGERRDSIEVLTVSLDSYLGDEPDVDVVKIDTQGAEVPVLLGMGSILRWSPPALVVEFWPKGLAGCGATGSQLLRLLAARGFSIGDAATARQVRACTVENGRHCNLMLERSK